jgi:hypothetical protein
VDLDVVAASIADFDKELNEVSQGIAKFCQELGIITPFGVSE